MRTVAVRHGGRTLLGRVWLADTPGARMRGLFGHPCPEDDGGLLLAPCSSVHMFGMRYPLDVVFLDADGRVRRLVRGLRPWRAAWSPGSHAALELRSGRIDELGLEPGMRLEWAEDET